MWVFGYGSLMWDGWETEFGGTRFDLATLRNFHRSFNKKSTLNWGTPASPGPTLGLEPRRGAECIGTAFEFPDERRDAVVANLTQREGSSFKLQMLAIELADGRQVQGLVPVNDRTRRTYLGACPLDDLVTLAVAAKGRDGTCVSYIENIGRKLQEIGIKDEHVETFRTRLKNRASG
jgi:glutathione-specific gamma-glutamylcyclotransferase